MYQGTGDKCPCIRTGPSNLMGNLPRELSMCKNQTFQSNGKLHITTPHHILDLKIHELGL